MATPPVATVTPPAAAQPVVAGAPPIILNETDVARFIREKTHVEAINPKHFENEDLFALPTIPGKKVKDWHVSGGKRVEYERDATIQDVNPQIHYIWLTRKDMEKVPDFMQNFTIASSSNHDGMEVPPNMWNTQGICTRGDHYLAFTTEEYYQKYVAAQNARTDARLKSFKPKVRDRDKSGKSSAACTQEMGVEQRQI